MFSFAVVIKSSLRHLDNVNNADAFEELKLSSPLVPTSLPSLYPFAFRHVYSVIHLRRAYEALEYGAVALDQDRGLLGIRSVDLGNLAAALDFVSVVLCIGYFMTHPPATSL